jgi:NAD(P)-dependent dehydrogenase (short-subunit alcohol dehydrogenase family)
MSTVLVTGGSSGIGLATVARLAAAGHQVFSGSRNAAAAGLPPGVTPVTVDVGDPASGRAAMAAVLSAAGGLDVLVNNAGAGAGPGALEEFPDERAHEIFEVNVFGPMRLAAAAVPVMRARGGGRIINVTSGNDTVPAPFGGWYSASKAALASLSTVLAAEVHAFGILVTVVAPGLFATPMAQRLTERHDHAGSQYAAALGALPGRAAAALEHAGNPDDVARAIEDCIAAGDPPARIVVGADAQELIKMIEDATPDQVAVLMREYVAGLAP